MVWMWRRHPAWFAFNAALPSILVLGIAWWWACLYVSLRRYLRLSRRGTWALLVGTQLIGLIAMFALLLRIGIGTDAVGHFTGWLESLWSGEPAAVDECCHHDP